MDFHRGAALRSFIVDFLMHRDDDWRLQYVMLALERLEHAADPPLQGHTSRDQRSVVLKLTTRTGLMCWPLSKPRMTVIQGCRVDLAPNFSEWSTEVVYHEIDGRLAALSNRTKN